MNALQDKRPVLPSATRSQAQVRAPDHRFLPDSLLLGNLTGFGDLAFARDFDDTVMIADCHGRMGSLQWPVIPVFYSLDKLT